MADQVNNPAPEESLPDDIGIPLFGFFNIEGESIGNSIPQHLVKLGALNQVGEPSAKLTQIFALEKNRQEFERKLKAPICQELLYKLIIETLTIPELEILADDAPLFRQMLAKELAYEASSKFDNEFRGKDFLSEAKLAQVTCEIKSTFNKTISRQQAALYTFFDQVLKEDVEEGEVRKEFVDELITITRDVLVNIPSENIVYKLSIFPTLKLEQEGIAIDINFYHFEDSKPEVVFVDRYLQQPIHPSSIVELAEQYKQSLIRLAQIYNKV